MLRYPYFCRTYNRLFSYFVDSGAFNLDVCPHTIHTTAAMHTEYKASEGIALCGTQKVYRSEETDSEAVAKLHIPVMVEEVVQCLTPQKGQDTDPRNAGPVQPGRDFASESWSAARDY